MHSDLSMPPVPDDLPWSRKAYLLIDGVSLPEAQRKLYEWAQNVTFDALYRGTHWHELSDLSPCLVCLDGPNDPILQRFIENAHEEWGYLIFGMAGFEDVLRHLRGLISVRVPSGDALLLRLADPAVAHQLLGTGNPRLFGPIEQICLPDCMSGIWWQHRRAGEQWEQTEEQPYRLGEAELEALGDVSLRQVVLGLHEHLQTFFPQYRASLRGRARLDHLRELAEQACELGLNSERDIFLYANIFGFLGVQPLESHPDIASLLHEKSSLTPAQRIEQAAKLAEQRAMPFDGSPL